MNALLAAALLATALVAGSDEEVVQRLDVRFDRYDLVATSCRDVIAREPEPGFASFQFRYDISGQRVAGSRRYSGKLTFSLGEIVIHVPRTISWPGMSEAARERTARLRRAIEHHEIGHVRIAEAVRDALNAEGPITEPDVFAFDAAASARGRDGFERFKREEREYDALTNHGRRQHAAPRDLAGPDSELPCPTEVMSPT
jgi:hypothetical protein